MMGASTPVPPRDPRKLTRSPIVNVIWQLRFTTEVSLKDGRAALAFQEALGRDATLSQQPDGLGFQLSVGGAGALQNPGADTAWRLETSDGIAVLLSPGTVSIETSNYSAWEGGFRSLIVDVEKAVVKSLAPSLQLRLGLRYVNVLFGTVVQQKPFRQLEDFGDYVEKSLLGFGSTLLGANVDMVQGRHALSWDGVKVNLNHAVVQSSESELGFLIDVDSYTERPQAFDEKESVETSERLHDIALAVFQSCVTHEAWNQMGPIGDG